MGRDKIVRSESGRKHKSGASKRKEAELKNQQKQKLALQAARCFEKIGVTRSVKVQEISSSEGQDATASQSVASVAAPSVTDTDSAANGGVVNQMECNDGDTSDVEEKGPKDTNENVLIHDPSTWPTPLTDIVRKQILNSCLEPKLSAKSAKIRLFLKKHLSDVRKNGEFFTRKWIRISPLTTSVFCMPCSVFGTGCVSPWTRFGNNQTGFTNFGRSGSAVRKHESSEQHFQSMKDWKLYQNKEMQVGSLSRVKKDHNVAQIKLVWRAVFDAVLFLAENNLAFRGNSSKLEALDCGNFLSLIRLLSKYYAPLATHLQKLKTYKTSYLSGESQNAFIRLIGQDVRRVLIEKIQRRKYFAIMFDGTPDISKQDQLSQIVRTVECSENGCIIHENFIDFIATACKTVKALSNVILEKLESDELDISNCRGQGYDNGSNMAGAYKGVQAKILEVNPFAHFIPCAAHSLNLVGTNAAEKVKSARLMLGEVQNLYNFFSSPTTRWKLLKEMGGVTLKCQSNTRWSSRANAVSALWTQFENIVEMLMQMTEDEAFSADVAATADSRLRCLLTFRFILGLSVWKSVLTQIDKCNEFLQLKNGEVNAASKRLASLCDWLRVFRESGFEECYQESASLASRLEVELSSGFENIRRHRGKNRKNMENSEREKLAGKSNLDVFKEEYFLALRDQIILEMSSRFKQIRTAAENFGFLWGAALEDSSSNFDQAVFNLTETYPNDLEYSEFFTEVKSLPSIVRAFSSPNTSIKSLGPLDVLNILYQNGLD